jgi:hypothetical protein
MSRISPEVNEMCVMRSLTQQRQYKGAVSDSGASGGRFRDCPECV